jgi:hypothetical protein
MKPNFVATCCLVSAMLLYGAAAGTTQACEKGDVYVEQFQRAVQDLEYDLAAVRSGQLRSSRFNFEWLEKDLRESFECIEKVCSPSEQKAILRYWNRFVEIRKTGLLKSPRPLVDPVPRR